MLCFLKVVTESQISWGWKGPLEFTWLNPLLRQGHQEPVAQDQVQKAFEYLPDITSTSYICGSVCNRKLDLSVCCSMATHLIWPTLWVTISSCIFLWLQILCNSKGEYFCSFISQVNTDRRSKHCCTEPSLETTAHSHVDSFTNPPPTFPQQVLRVHTCFHSTNHLPWLYCQKKKKKEQVQVWFLVIHCSYPAKLYWPIESSEPAAALLFNSSSYSPTETYGHPCQQLFWAVSSTLLNPNETWLRKAHKQMDSSRKSCCVFFTAQLIV